MPSFEGKNGPHWEAENPTTESIDSIESSADLPVSRTQSQEHHTELVASKAPSLPAIQVEERLDDPANQLFLKVIDHYGADLPFLVFQKEINGKVYTQALQGEIHIQGETTANKASQFRTLFHYRMLEDADGKDNLVDQFLTALRLPYTLGVKLIPRLSGGTLKQSGILEEAKNNRDRTLSLESDHTYSNGERMALGALGLWSWSALATVPSLALSSSIVVFSAEFPPLLEGFHVALKHFTHLAGIGSVLALGASHLFPHSKFNGIPEFNEDPFMAFLMRPSCQLIGHRNETFAKTIDQFWSEEPEERSGVATCGFTHLPGTADALKELGWKKQL